MNTNSIEIHTCCTHTPLIENSPQAAIQNTNYRAILWTGHYAQMTLLSIPKCSDIGLEMHEDTNQIIRIESGTALVEMRACNSHPDIRKNIFEGDTIFVPAGTIHPQKADSEKTDYKHHHPYMTKREKPPFLILITETTNYFFDRNCIFLVGTSNIRQIFCCPSCLFYFI